MVTHTLGRRPQTAVFVCLLLALAVTSTPRIVGDGAEYVRLAERLASGHLPGAGESRHFLFYPALAAPLIAMGATAAAFTIVNAVLLAGAFLVAASRLRWAWCALVFVGPILWWLDKPHTEPFTFAMYAVAFTLVDAAPWWSLVAVGAAATQNPGNGLLVAILAVAAAARRRALLKDRRFWAGLAGGVAIAALHPLYYLARLGKLTSLASAGDVRWVTLREYVTVLVDPNLGLLPQVPIFAAAVVLGLLLLLARAPRSIAVPGIVAAAASAAWLAFVAATATNVNHGGTPGMSRYATWFIPLAIPLFAELDRVLGRRAGWMALPAIVSAALGIWWFHPARTEAVDHPTRLASYLWTEHPSLDNPLPEVFTERLRGLDQNWLPVATPGCEKVLLPGRGGRDSVWPMPCAPATPPARCQVAGATCYANRTKTGYAFVEPRVSAPQAFRLARSDTWPLSAEPFVADALASLRWWEMGIARAGEPGAVIRSSSRVGRVFTWQGPDRLFVFAVDVEPGAELLAEPGVDMRASLTTERGTVDGSPLQLKAGTGPQVISLPAPQPWVMLVAEARQAGVREGGSPPVGPYFPSGERSRYKTLLKIGPWMKALFHSVSIAESTGSLITSASVNPSAMSWRIRQRQLSSMSTVFSTDARFPTAPWGGTTMVSSSMRASIFRSAARVPLSVPPPSRSMMG